jgi:hypothetical protein
MAMTQQIANLEECIHVSMDCAQQEQPVQPCSRAGRCLGVVHILFSRPPDARTAMHFISLHMHLRVLLTLIDLLTDQPIRACCLLGWKRTRELSNQCAGSTA